MVTQTRRMTCSPTSTTGVLSASRPPSTPGRALDAESLSWWSRLHAVDPVRHCAITELHERLRREARFHIRRRAGCWSDFPRSDVEDLAVQAADDALLVLLRKLDGYRGDSQFWTWARRFAELEASVSVRRGLGHERRVSGDPERALRTVVAPGGSVQERVEFREVLQTVSDLIVAALTPRQRIVVVAIAINGVSVRTLASDLDTTPGAIYKTLHDARVKLRVELESKLNGRRVGDRVPACKEAAWTCA
jgi:RNA polymerase sigma-70 factor (ECF subfamily)